MIEIINNFFTEDKVLLFNNEIKKSNWKLNQTSVLSPARVEQESSDNEIQYPAFWYNDIIHTDALSLFTEEIKIRTGLNIEVLKLYSNGQAHGQCGFWHVDAPLGMNGYLTLVYFYKKWKPEYGGHLMIKNNEEVVSILPEYNTAVLLDSTMEHMGMEPTVHCKTQRESIACKFRIID